MHAHHETGNFWCHFRILPAIISLKSESLGMKSEHDCHCQAGLSGICFTPVKDIEIPLHGLGRKVVAARTSVVFWDENGVPVISINM